MYVACSTLCFARLPLERALRLMAELEFSKVDVAITEQGSHLKPSEIVKDIALAAQRIRIGPTLTPAAFSIDFDGEYQDEEVKLTQLKAICRLARCSTVPLISFPASASGVGIDAEVKLGKHNIGTHRHVLSLRGELQLSNAYCDERLGGGAPLRIVIGLRSRRARSRFGRKPQL